MVLICANFQVDILKNGWVLIFWMCKMVASRAISWNFCIFLFLNFIWCRPFRKVLKSHFSRCWQKTDLKTCITPPKPEIFSLTFPWPRDVRWLWPYIYSMLTESIGCHLEVSQTRFMLVFNIYIRKSCSAWQIQTWQNVKHSYFYLACDSVGEPEAKSVGFPRCIFQIYRTLFELCKSVR